MFQGKSVKGYLLEKKRILILAIATATVLTVVAVMEASAGTGDEVAIRQVVAGAERAQQTLDVPAPGTWVAHRHMSDAAVQAWNDRIVRDLGKYYTGRTLKQMVEVIQAHAVVQADGSTTEVAGGVDQLELDSLDVHGDTATAKARIDKWLKFGDPQSDGSLRTSVTRGTVIHSYQLARTDDGWHIVRYEVSFPGGSGP